MMNSMKWRNIELSVILVVSAGLLFLTAGAAGCCKTNHNAEDTPKPEPPRFVVKSAVWDKNSVKVKELVVIEDTQGSNDFLVIATYNGVTMMPIGRTNR